MLAELGAELQARDDRGDTPLQMSIKKGHHQVEQVLRQLERMRKAKKDIAREPAASQDTPEAREAADRMAAAIIEEEEREQEAAQSKAKGKGKAKAGKASKSGGGGGPSNKAGAGASAAGSSGQAGSSQGGSRPSELRPGSSSLRTTQEAVQAAPPVAEATSGTQQPDPQPQPAGGGKKDKERQRKERQRLRRLHEAREMLDVAMAAMEQTGVRCVHALHPRPVPHPSAK